MKRITTILLSLSLFGLVGCDDLVKNFDFDEEGYGHLNWDILDYCESPAANAYDNYSDAMRMAGLDEVLAEGGYTCIIPNNEAFTSFIGAAGYSRLEEVPGPVLRDLLSYLIFPGDYRVSTMEVGEECTVNSLRGEPITIKRSTNAKSYTLTINGVDGLAAVTVESQDYLFKNNIVGQMVEVMPYYRPSVPATSPKPDGYGDGGAATERIDLTDDTFIAVGNKTKVYNNDSQGIRLQNRSGYYCYGLTRFPLPESKVAENLAVATMVMQIQKLGTPYPAG
ncbi:MAG: fasciclin domain-containing protein, partial [Alistipes sp.]|nr:fasciclin domain-containing protein [Alistipes sp.]